LQTTISRPQKWTRLLVAQFPVDVRLKMAVDGFLAGHFDTVSSAAREWDAPYHTAVRRVKAAQKIAIAEPPPDAPPETIVPLTVEQRVQRAVDGFKRGQYRIRREAARTWDVPYYMTLSRLGGAHSRAENVSGNCKFPFEGYEADFVQTQEQYTEVDYEDSFGEWDIHDDGIDSVDR